MDLLLVMIQKQKLNIYDIEISVLLDQFLNYLERMTEADIEVTSDFLEMAARLILIKSAALLPKEEAEKMKQELQGQLIELALAKIMAGRLKKRYRGDTIFVRKPAAVDIDPSYNRRHQPEEILLAYGAVAERSRRKAEYERVTEIPVVKKNYASVYAGVVAVLKSLMKGRAVEMETLFEGQPRSCKVARFMAILELSKFGRILISEDGKSSRPVPVSREERSNARRERIGSKDSTVRGAV